MSSMRRFAFASPIAFACRVSSRPSNRGSRPAMRSST
jgi:hypothetical protein